MNIILFCIFCLLCDAVFYFVFFKVGSCNNWELWVIKVVNIEKTNGLIVYNLLLFSRFTGIN